MEQYNICVISENKNYSEALASRILLSRKFDIILSTTYNQFFNNTSVHQPDLLIIKIQNEEHLEFLKKIKSKKQFADTFIIVITDKFEKETVCKIFDLEINDIVDIRDDETILNMRIIWALKNKVVKDNLEQKSKILYNQNITEKNTNFYLENYTYKIFKNEYQKCLTNYKPTIFMAISPDIKYKDNISIHEIGNLIPKIFRKNDLIGYNNNYLYLLLNQSNQKGAKTIFDKINNLLPFECSISAAAIDIKFFENFQEAEKKLNKLLEKALQEENAFIFSNKNTPAVNPIFGKITPDFGTTLKKTVDSELEKIIPPIFFKMQSIYEPKLYNTKIKQTMKNEEYSFFIKNGELSSNIIISQENKTIIIKTEETFNKKTENAKYNIQYSELSIENLENIIQKVIEKFRKRLYKRENE